MRFKSKFHDGAELTKKCLLAALFVLVPIESALADILTTTTIGGVEVEIRRGGESELSVDCFLSWYGGLSWQHRWYSEPLGG